MSLSYRDFILPNTRILRPFAGQARKAKSPFCNVGGRPWRLRLHASGMRPSGPLNVQISVNGQIAATQVWGGEMADHELLISRDQAGVGGSIEVELATKPFVVPPDARH